MLNDSKPLKLGEFELETLEHIWREGQGNVKSVHAVLGQKRGTTLNTIQSTLDRLFKKGLLDRKKQGHSYQYYGTHNRTELLTRKINELAVELSGGEMSPLFAAFIEFTSRVDETKLDELEALIARHKAARDQESS